MNHYERKQAERRERLQETAEKKRQKANSTITSARHMGDAIPFGQPILVGHHSEKADRRYRERMQNKYRRGFEEMDKAEYYESKAAAVGKGGVSSDDPDAVSKLTKQLERDRKAQQDMKAANKLVRKNDIAGLVAMGFTEEQANDLMKDDFAGRKGFPAYALQNNNANIKRLEKRIKELEAQSSREDFSITENGYTYKEDTEDNRVMFFFDGKPSDEVREILKRYGFKWSPSRDGKPWVRKMTANGLGAGRMARESLKKIS